MMESIRKIQEFFRCTVKKIRHWFRSDKIYKPLQNLKEDTSNEDETLKRQQDIPHEMVRTTSPSIPIPKPRGPYCDQHKLGMKRWMAEMAEYEFKTEIIPFKPNSKYRSTILEFSKQGQLFGGRKTQEKLTDNGFHTIPIGNE